MREPGAPAFEMQLCLMLMMSAYYGLGVSETFTEGASGMRVLMWLAWYAPALWIARLASRAGATGSYGATGGAVGFVSAIVLLAGHCWTSGTMPTAGTLALSTVGLTVLGVAASMLAPAAASEA